MPKMEHTRHRIYQLPKHNQLRDTFVSHRLRMMLSVPTQKQCRNEGKPHLISQAVIRHCTSEPEPSLIAREYTNLSPCKTLLSHYAEITLNSFNFEMQGMLTNNNTSSRA